MSTYVCSGCGQSHEGLPLVWGPDLPIDATEVPQVERRRRVRADADGCVLDRTRFFVRGCLDLPILHEPQVFQWLVWVEVSRSAYGTMRSRWRQLRGRPFPETSGALAVSLGYASPTRGLSVLLTDGGSWMRPRVRVPDTSHPLGSEQHIGLSLETAYEKAGQCWHTWSGSAA